MRLKQATEIEFIEFLEDHEQEIALDMNDFGRLASVFVETKGRQPEETRAKAKAAEAGNDNSTIPAQDQAFGQNPRDEG
jgi:hypothetical protein